jgi:HK97 family phage portal protein
MANRKLIERITNAVTALRDPIPVKTLGDITAKTKPQDRPDFGQGWIGGNYPYRGWYRNRDGDGLYREDINSLDSSSLIMAIVNWTGVNLAEALPVVFKPDSKGVPQIDIGNPAANLIRRPNPFFTWADYCQAGAFDWWMGDWYMQKVHDLSGSLIELWYIPKLLIKPRWPFDGGSPEVPLSEVDGDPSQAFISHYQYNRPGKTPVLIKKSNMVHIKHGVNRHNPREGECVWEPVLTEIYGDNAVARFSAALMKNMGLVRYFLSPKDKDNGPNEPQALAMQEQFERATSGGNAGRPLVSTGAMDVTTLSMSPKDLDLKELRKEPQSRVAGVAGVPAILVQYLVGLENGHYGAAYEQARQQGYESVIIPIQNHIAEDLTWQVLPELDKTKGAKFGFDISKVRVLQEDRDALYKRESDALRAGGITIDQFLTSIGKDALGSPLGDVRFVPSTSTPMSPEKIKALAEDLTPPTPQPIDQASLAKFLDMERMFADLESQMKGFEVPK